MQIIVKAHTAHFTPDLKSQNIRTIRNWIYGSAWKDYAVCSGNEGEIQHIWACCLQAYSRAVHKWRRQFFWIFYTPYPISAVLKYCLLAILTNFWPLPPSDESELAQAIAWAERVSTWHVTFVHSARNRKMKWNSDLHWDCFFINYFNRISLKIFKLCT